MSQPLYRSLSRSLIIYLTGIPLSLAYNSYNDAKEAMYIYRNNLNDYDKKRFYNEETYVKHCVFREIPINLFMTSIWPLTLPMNFVPAIARYMNPSNN